MTGIFGIMESSARQCYQDVAPTQQFFFPFLARGKKFLKKSQKIQSLRKLLEGKRVQI
jgi:hypothetical protein